jgi:hypothetical protein
MPILTQRGIYEKVNSVEAAGNSWQMIVKEIASDLSVLATAPLQGSFSLAFSLFLSLPLCHTHPLSATPPPLPLSLYLHAYARARTHTSIHDTWADPPCTHTTQVWW